MRTLLTSALILLTTFSSSAQAWTQKQNFGGDSRILPSSYTVGSKGYVTGGLRVSTNRPTNQHWEYDTNLDRWVRRKDFNGEERWGAFSFTIDGKGYVGGGDVGWPGANNYSGTFYQYDPVTNSWGAKAILSSRSESVGFSINGKGYVAWGYNNVTGTKDGSVLEYNPAIGTQGTWVFRGNIQNIVDKVQTPEQPGVAFVVNNVAYITGGQLFFTDTYKFDPAANYTWVNTVSNMTLDPYSAFTLKDEGYIIGERNIGPNQFEDVLMKYNTSTNSWTKIAGLPTQMSSDKAFMFNVTPCENEAIIGNSSSGRFFKFNPVSSVTSGPSLLCNSAQGAYTVSNIPDGAAISWTKSSNLTIVSGQNTTSVTVRAASSGTSSGWVKPAINGCQSEVANLWVGKPLNVTGSMSGPTTVYKSNLYIYRVTDQNHSSGPFHWTVPRGCSITAGGDGYNYIQMWVGSRASSGYVQVWRTNSCGNGGARSKYVTVSGGGGGGPNPIRLLASPNPTRDEVSIEFTEIETLEAYLDNLDERKNGILRIEIIGIYDGNIVHRGVINKDGLKLNLRNIKKGIYIVRVFNREFSNDVKLVVE